MLHDLIINKELDACIACKNDNKFLFKILRIIYYVLTSFSTGTTLVRGFMVSEYIERKLFKMH